MVGFMQQNQQRNKPVSADLSVKTDQSFPP
jgi:hypothetical protein